MHGGDDLMLYDAVGPFVRRGEDPAGRLERWIVSYRTGIGHEIRDLEITAGTDLAFCRFLVRQLYGAALEVAVEMGNCGEQSRARAGLDQASNRVTNPSR